MIAVDDMHQNLPLLEKDKYWVDKGPSYPSATMKPVFMGSTHDMRYNDRLQHLSIIFLMGKYQGARLICLGKTSKKICNVDTVNIQYTVGYIIIPVM